MEAKQVPSKLFYCAEKELTIPEIPEFAEAILEPLYKDAESLRLKFTGPPEFIYFSSTGDPNEPLHLLIAIPVKGSKPSKSDYFFLETMPFDCVSVDYKGSMVNIGKAWEDLIQQVLSKGYYLSNQGREIYKKWISFESENNITELQIGIAAKRIT
jgi:hypothetical protein